MKESLYFIFIILLFFVHFLHSGTTGKIAGRVVDKETGEALPSVNIVLSGTTIGASTNLDGEYYILNIPAGTYLITASMIGYQEITKAKVRVNIDQTTIVDFKLSSEVIEGEEIVIVAERPRVELDLTASKAKIYGEDIQRSWVSNINDIVHTQSGVNVNDGVRGGFGLDITYFVDGVEIREGGSNSSFASINTSSIEQMELMTGGYNAEYGRANGAIVNVVTKRAKSAYHGSISYKVRPAGKYHWGRNIYSQENIEWTQMATLEYWTQNTGGGSYVGKTPEERLAAWKRFISGEMFGSEDLLINYDQRMQWELESTFYGPITSKLDFMISARWLEGVSPFPSPLKYNPEWNAHLNLNYQLSNRTEISLVGMFSGTNNSYHSKTFYATSEDNRTRLRRRQGAFFNNPYERYKYVYWVGTDNENSMRSPEYVRQGSGSIKVNHVFSPSTFIDFRFNHLALEHWSDSQDIIVIPWTGPDFEWPENQIPPDNPLFITSGFGDFRRDKIWYSSSAIEVDFTSQVNKQNQIKIGAEFSYQGYKRYWQEGVTSQVWMTHFPEAKMYHPYEGSAFVQDKIELTGMVINAGVRLDFFNANKKVNDTFWDPWQIDERTTGNIGMNIYSFDPDGPYARKTPTQWAISPRIGISHPITESTVLHFMYGHFNMRPGWLKILTEPTANFRPWPEGSMPDGEPIPIDQPVFYQTNAMEFGNPALEYEKMIQYEIGFDQDIVGWMNLDLTMYIKDAKNLTSVGFQRGRADTYGYETTDELWVRLYPDYTDPGSRTLGHTGWFRAFVNGGAMDVRGLEVSLETRHWRNVTFRILYDLSYAYSTRYGARNVYQEFEDGTKNGEDTVWDVGNGDGGVSGNNNQRWNPRNIIKFFAYISTPPNYGPNILGVNFFGNFYLSLFSSYSSGPLFTYHPPGDFSTVPNNMQWEGRYRTNIKIAKKFHLYRGFTAEFSLDVHNLFNQKTLKLLSGDELRTYMETGGLPEIPQTGEPNEWTIYDFNNMPRQLFFGFRMEF